MFVVIKMDIKSVEATPACAPGHSRWHLEKYIHIIRFFLMVFKMLTTTGQRISSHPGGRLTLKLLSRVWQFQFKRLKLLAHLDMFKPDNNVFQPDTADVIFLHSPLNGKPCHAKLKTNSNIRTDVA